MILAVGALDALIPLTPVDPSKDVEGEPRTGVLEFGRFRDDCGVWEMTPGAMSDVEEDEIFVVIGGAATLECVDDGTVLELRVGTTALLTAGTRTIWRVTETLRKVWWVPTAAIGQVAQ